MSLPKEPRQKMINMMYLVLTAMLALNVSAEILNAFKTVNNSIIGSNTVITDKNNVTYKSLADKLNQDATKENAKIWAPIAMDAQKLSANIYDEIQGLKDRLIEEAGPYTEDGVKKYRDDDLDAATRLMDEKGEGKKLYEDLKTYKTQLLNILKPEEFASNPVLQKDVREAKDAFSRQLPLNLSVPPSQSGNINTGDSAKDWTVNYFHMTPAIAAMTILSKFQNDVKSSESQIIDYCHKKIGEVVVRYDQTGVIAGANSTYLMPGDKLQVYAGVGAFSSSVAPIITINGELEKVDAEGKATKEFTVGGSGKQVVKVNVTYKDQNGVSKTVPKEIPYTVGTPSGVAVSADKMNVLYIMGPDMANPLTISGGSGSEKITATMTGGTLKHVQGSSFEAFPTVQGEQTINVTIDGKTTKKIFRVKRLPNPLAYVGTKPGGSISSAEFKAIGGLQAKLENTEFLAPFRVISYKIAAIGGAITQAQQYTVEGNRWSGNAEALVRRATPGTTVFFDEIRVVGPDGQQREIAPVFFSLK